jgi:outer membrane protein TolC
VLSLASELASTEATLPPLRQKIAQANHLLATLMGEAPADLPSMAEEPGLELTDFQLPLDLPLSLPSALVRQRPDILLAEAQLVNANAQIGVSTSIASKMWVSSSRWREHSSGPQYLVTPPRDSVTSRCCS